jgi:hypothetical protein
MDDAEFEAYISRRSRLSRRYQDLQAEFPPKELDEAVLSRARSAHTLKRAEIPEREVYIGWMAPVAFAATVVLVFTVVLQVVIRPQLGVHGQSDADRSASVQHAAEPAIRAREAGAAADSAPVGTLAVPTTAKHSMAGKVAQEAPASAARDRAQPAIPQPVQAARVDEAVVAAQPIAESRPEKKEAEVAAPAPAAAAPTTGGVRSMAESGNYSQPIANEKLQNDPQAWLAEIVRLRKSGQSEAADRQMKLFLAKYPDYFRTHPLPDDAR